MTTDGVGGVWSYSVDLAAELCARGAHILLATFGPRLTQAQRRECEPIAGLEIAESDFPLEWMPNCSDEELAAGADWLLDLARHFDANIIHLNNYCYGALPWNAPAIVVAHSDVFSWWQATHGTNPPSEWQRYHQRVSGGLAGAFALVAPTRTMMEALQHNYRVTTSRAEVIPNFSRLPLMTSCKQPLLLAAGRLWDKSKNLSLLNGVATQCAWPIHLAGAATSPSGDHSAYDHVTLLGALSRQQLAEKFATASIFLHPSLYEPFGLGVLEAARNRCALVLADIPSLRELWADTALFADPHAPEEWIDAINRLIQNESLRKEYGERAFLRSTAFSVDRAINNYLDLYLDVTNNNIELGLPACPAETHFKRQVSPANL